MLCLAIDHGVGGNRVDMLDSIPCDELFKLPRGESHSIVRDEGVGQVVSGEVSSGLALLLGRK